MRVLAPLSRSSASAASRWVMKSPDRVSTTKPKRLPPSWARPSSATLAISAGGRLSMTKNPRSSSTSAAADRPAPDMPVMIVTSISGADAAAPDSGTRPAVQMREQRPPDPLRQPRDRDHLVLGQLPQPLHRAELLEEAPAPRRTEPGDIVEHRPRHLLVPKLAVVRDREAVGLVAHLLEEVERLGVARDLHRLVAPGHVDLFEPFGEGGHADLLEAQLLQHADRHAELALPAVDEQQVGRI